MFYRTKFSSSKNAAAPFFRISFSVVILKLCVYLCVMATNVSAKEEEQAWGSAWTICMALLACRVSSPCIFRAIIPLNISPENTSIIRLEGNPLSMQPAL